MSVNDIVAELTEKIAASIAESIVVEIDGKRYKLDVDVRHNVQVDERTMNKLREAPAVDVQVPVRTEEVKTHDDIVAEEFVANNKSWCQQYKNKSSMYAKKFDAFIDAGVQDITGFQPRLDKAIRAAGL